MAIERINRISTLFGSPVAVHGTGVATSAAFTPHNTSLLVARLSGIAETDSGMRGSDLTITDSVGLTWTSRAVSGAPASWSLGDRVWTAPVTTGASMTVSGDCGAFDIRGYVLQVYEYIGHNVSSPVGGTGNGSDADGDGAASLTLSSSPLPGSQTLGFATVSLSAGTGAINPGAAFTEITETGIAGWFEAQSQFSQGLNSTTVDWADLNSGAGTPSAGLMIALEIKAAAIESSFAGRYLRRSRYPL